MVWINKGVARFPAVYIVAVESILNELTGVIGGLLYFQASLRSSLSCCSLAACPLFLRCRTACSRNSCA